MVARGVRGCGGGACMVAGGHAWLQGGVRGIRRDTVNERAVRILLECILVLLNISDLEKVEKKCAEFLLKPGTNIIPETTTVTF